MATSDLSGKENSEQPVFVTPRLYIRPMLAEDAPGLHVAFSDPETMRFMDFPDSRDMADTERRMQVYLFKLPAWHATWSLVYKATGAVVGFVNYHHRENWNSRLEVGFMLARPYWGGGLMVEAMTALLEYCFEGLNMHRVEITVTPENHAAIRMIERVGFRLEGGPLRARQRVNGEYRDLSMYGLLKPEWEAIARPHPKPDHDFPA